MSELACSGLALTRKSVGRFIGAAACSSGKPPLFARINVPHLRHTDDSMYGRRSIGRAVTLVGAVTLYIVTACASNSPTTVEKAPNGANVNPPCVLGGCNAPDLDISTATGQWNADCGLGHHGDSLVV